MNGVFDAGFSSKLLHVGRPVQQGVAWAVGKGSSRQIVRCLVAMARMSRVDFCETEVKYARMAGTDDEGGEW